MKSLGFPDLLLLEDDPVKEELQSLIGVVDAKLLKTVHLQLLKGTKRRHGGANKHTSDACVTTANKIIL